MYLDFFKLQGKDKTMSVLRGLLQDLGAELRDEQIRFDSEVKATHGKAAEVRVVFTLQACVPTPPPCARGRAMQRGVLLMIRLPGRSSP